VRYRATRLRRSHCRMKITFELVAIHCRSLSGSGIIRPSRQRASVPFYRCYDGY